MKQASVADLESAVSKAVRRWSLAGRVRSIDVEPAEARDGWEFLRVHLWLDSHEGLDYDTFEPLRRSIRDAIEPIDERFPSIRFPEAA